MPITTAFTITALFAALVNVWFLGRAVGRRRLLIELKEDGELMLVANSLVLIWTTILVSDLLILTAGVGLLTGVRVLGYLLAVMPIASSLIGLFALRGLLKGG